MLRKVFKKLFKYVSNKEEVMLAPGQALQFAEDAIVANLQKFVWVSTSSEQEYPTRVLGAVFTGKGDGVNLTLQLMGARLGTPNVEVDMAHFLQEYCPVGYDTRSDVN